MYRGNAAAVAPQPFFEAALAGTGYCNGFANCTQAVIANEGLNGTGNLTNASVWSLYSDLDNGGFNFPRSMMNTPLNCPTGSQIGCSGQLTSGVGMITSVGYGNYNALFITLKSQDWHGVTMQSNFTWSKALGTGSEVQATSAATPPDPFPTLGPAMAIRLSIADTSTTCSSCISHTGTSRNRA